MAIKRTSNNSVNNAVKLSTGFSSAAIPNSPTIGTATAGEESATVTYTAATLGATATTFTATSSPGSITGTGSSPITISALTGGTSYTFTVTATNANGTSAASSASNSVTPTGFNGVPSFYSIASYTVPSDTSSVVQFTSIDQTYKDLMIIIRAGATYGGAGGGSGGRFYLNNDLTAKYTWAYINGNGNGSSSGVTSGGYGPTSNWDFGASWASNVNSFMSSIFILQDYTNTSKLKTWRNITGLYCGNGTNSGTAQYSGLYNSTSAITSVQFHHGSATGSDGNLREGSQIQLFGIKG